MHQAQSQTSQFDPTCSGDLSRNPWAKTLYSNGRWKWPSAQNLIRYACRSSSSMSSSKCGLRWVLINIRIRVWQLLNLEFRINSERLSTILSNSGGSQMTFVVPQWIPLICGSSGALTFFLFESRMSIDFIPLAFFCTCALFLLGVVSERDCGLFEQKFLVIPELRQ